MSVSVLLHIRDFNENWHVLGTQLPVLLYDEMMRDADSDSWVGLCRGPLLEQVSSHWYECCLNFLRLFGPFSLEVV